MVRRRTALEPIVLGTDVGSTSSGSFTGSVIATGSVTARTLQDRFADWANILDFGADKTGATDCSAAITAALAASSYVRIPKGNYKVSNIVTIPASSSIYGEEGAKVVCYTSGTFAVGNSCTISGIHFDANSPAIANIIPVYLPVVGGVAAHDIIIENCSFDGAAGGSAILGDNGVRECVIRDCVFTTGSNGPFLNGALRCSILRCRFNSVSRAIHMQGGRQNLIAGNKINNGIVGILFLSARPNGANNLTFGNSIVGNEVFSTSEEGISFDCNGNQSAQWPENSVNPVVTMVGAASISPSQMVFTISETGQSVNWASTYYAIPLNGTNVGHPYLIEASNSGTLTVTRSSGEGNAFVGGEKLLITMPFMSNTVVGNTVAGSGTACIAVYGSCWGNVVSKNTCVAPTQYGIICGSVATGLGSSGAWGAQCWSGRNIIDGNTIENTHSGGNSTEFRTPIFCGTYVTGTVPVGYLYHVANRITNNVCLTNKLLLVDTAHRTYLEGNDFSPGGGCSLEDTDSTVWGDNWRCGTRYAAPTLVGVGNTNVINRQAVAQANIGAAPSQSDFNTLLTNLRDAQVLAP